jgi:uncharacterized Ntn-hydrolase superfamily protein
MTYSIVARDPATGALGVAVQTCMFAVGAIAPWARAGIGAVATQAFAEPAYGPRCLAALEAGASAVDALAEAKGADPSTSLRQVGVVSFDGSVAAWTGEACIDHAGHVLGEGFAVQANMMATPDVGPAMADAFSASTEPLSRRLLTALDAGQSAGGDARGMMSAALLVVQAERGDAWTPPVTDLRVDRADDPLRDLRRLLDASEAFVSSFKAQRSLALDGDATVALRAIDNALAALPDEPNFRFVRVRALLAAGDIENGRAELRSLIASRPTWETIVRSFAVKGYLVMPESCSIDALLE